ncbi:hypothetical protein M1384_02710 [Candidatus Parvarchaeota archaeon]|jgi:hypothetical protein|nr:hypothetical protein [Candidatus Parvarchaeota archaeon]
MEKVKNNGFMCNFSIKFVNFIKNLSENLEFFEEKVYKGYAFLYILGVE